MPILKAKMMMIIAFISVYTACCELQVHLELVSSKDNNKKCIDGLLSTEKIQLIGYISDRNKELKLKLEKGEIFIKGQNKVNKTNELTIESLKLENCSEKTNEKFTCEISIDNKKIMTNYTESARTAFNNVSLFMSVSYDDKVYNSSLLELPRIYDPEKITVFVNDQKLYKNNTAIIVKNSTLHFRCPDKIKPCELFIYKQKLLVKSNQTSLVLENVDIENNDYTFVCKVCDSELLSTYSPCLINEIQEGTDEKSKDKEKGLEYEHYRNCTIALGVCFAVFGIIILSIFLYR